MKLHLRLLNLGVSPIVAVLLLIVITSFLSIILYFYVLPMIYGVSYSVRELVIVERGDIMIDDIWYKNGEIHVYVRNLGSKSVTITSLYIEYNGEIIKSVVGINEKIESYDVIELSYPVNLESGKSYLVIVYTERGSSAERRLVLWG